MTNQRVVKFLREYAKERQFKEEGAYDDGIDGCYQAGLLREAADEIDRLSSEVGRECHCIQCLRHNASWGTPITPLVKDEPNTNQGES